MALEIRLIPGIEECNKILLNHYEDLSLYDDLISLERFRGPSSVLAQNVREKKPLFETEFDIINIISGINFQLDDIKGLIPRLHKEITSENQQPLTSI
jgi:hypothetical protein